MQEIEPMLIREEFLVDAGDYQRAGEASATIKRKLKQLGISSTVLRRMAIAA